MFSSIFIFTGLIKWTLSAYTNLIVNFKLTFLPNVFSANNKSKFEEQKRYFLDMYYVSVFVHVHVRFHVHVHMDHIHVDFLWSCNVGQWPWTMKHLLSVQVLSTVLVGSHAWSTGAICTCTGRPCTHWILNSEHGHGDDVDADTDGRKCTMTRTQTCIDTTGMRTKIEIMW